MITQTYHVDMTPGSITEVIHVSQYDTGERTLVFKLYQGSVKYVVPDGATVTVRGGKKDGTIYEYKCSVDDNIVTADVTSQMTAVAGTHTAEIRVYSGTTVVGTANINMFVEKSPFPENYKVSATELPIIEGGVQSALNAEASSKSAAQYAKNAATSANKAASTVDTLLKGMDVTTKATSTGTDVTIKAGGKSAKFSVANGTATDAQVTAWLDAHPEATTTVQDGVITTEKLSSDLQKTISTLQTDAATHANGFLIGDDGLLYLTHDGTVVSEGVEVGKGSGGLAFNSGYVSDDGYMHLTQDGTDIEGFDPFFVGTGSGSGASGSRLVFSISSANPMSVLDSATEALITGAFTSTDTTSGTATGYGNLTIFVGGVVKENRTLEQGSFSIDVVKYLTSGSNTIKLSLTDQYGATATRNITITKESFGLSWNLDDTEINSGTLTVYLTPTGAGTKTLYLLVDGNQYETTTVSTSGRRVAIQVALNAGAHEISAYGTAVIDSNTVTSDTLVSEVIQTSSSSTTPIVAAKLAETSTKQFTALTIPYRVVNPSENPTTVEMYVNGTLYTSQSVDQSEHTWVYRATASGSLKLGIKCGTASWTKTITVEAITDDIAEVTQDLEMKLDASTITSLTEWKSGDATITLSDNFDTHNGGIGTDSDGVQCIRVVAGDRLTVNCKLFATDPRKNGKEFDLIYKVESSSDFDAEAISCMSDGIGFNVTANGIVLKSEQTSLEYQTCEGNKTEAKFNIEPDSDNRLMMLWEMGTPAKAAVYAANDSFIQQTPVGITVGSDDCTVLVYTIRVYSRDLTKEEIKANFIMDGKDADEIVARYERNQIYDSAGNIDPDAVANLNPNLHVLTWHAENVSTAKSQKIKGTVTHKYVNGGTKHNWTASGVTQKAQGTSSLGYVQAGCNEDFSFDSGFDIDDGTHVDTYSMTDDSIGVNYLNFKTNVASQEHVNNIGVSEWLNKYQPYIRTARQNNSKVRDTVEGHMAVMFFHNTGSSAVDIGPYSVQPDETILYSLGCLNNSKKNDDVFVYDDIVVEVDNNISDQCRFKSDDLSSETWDGDTNFEFRHLNEDVYTEAEAKALWQEFLSWVVACDADSAPNTAFETPVTISGTSYKTDSAEYRKAKFTAEAADHIEMDSVAYHQVMTLIFSQVDNRAKNTFWGYSKNVGKWNLNFEYDNDTAMGNDNEGGLTLKYGYMDTDSIGTRNVFNAADSAIFAMMRYCFADTLREMYISRENAGAFDLDEFADYCDEMQSYACESLWIDDVWRKDIDTLINLGTSAYIPMLNGKKRLQRRQFLHYQRAFMSSYFIGSYAVSDTATVRGYTPTTWNGVEPAGKMTITPYSDLWVTVRAGSSDIQKRATAGEAVEIDLGVSSMNDTEIYVRNSSFIQDLGDLACLYPGYIDISNCVRLKTAKIGSGVTGYQNTNMKEITVSNATSLESIDVQNCPSLAQELDLSKNVLLKECLTIGSGVTGVTFADWGRLATAKLNAVSSIYAHNLSYLETFTLESPDQIKGLNLAETPYIETVAFVTAASALARVRLIGVNWRTTASTYDLLNKLYAMSGIDDDGHETSNGVVTGSIYFDAISQTKLDELKGKFTNVEFTYGTLLQEFTVTFYSDEDGTTVGNTQKVEAGGSAVDPVANGLMDTPTKDATSEYVYAFSGWDTTFDTVYGDISVKPQFSRSTHYYTVKFLDGNGNIVETHDNLSPHATVSYEGSDLEKTGYLWTGWDNEDALDDITSDITETPTFSYIELPSSTKDLTNYDYAYSDVSTDTSAYTFGELYAITKMGKTSDYLSYGAKIKMKCRSEIVRGILSSNDEEIVFMLAAIGHYELVSGGMSKADFYMAGVLWNGMQHHETNINTGGWDQSLIRTKLNDGASSIYYNLPSHWKKFIAQSITLANDGDKTTTAVTASNDYLRIPSHAEMGFDKTTAPYSLEVSSSAAEVQLPIFTDNNSRIRKQKNGAGNARYWWLRSADSSGSTSFRGVNDNGYAHSWYAGDSHCVCLGFSV